MGFIYGLYVPFFFYRLHEFCRPNPFSFYLFIASLFQLLFSLLIISCCIYFNTFFLRISEAEREIKRDGELTGWRYFISTFDAKRFSVKILQLSLDLMRSLIFFSWFLFIEETYVFANKASVPKGSQF